MRGRLATLASVALFASGSACAMNTPESSPSGCRVIGGELLPPESGGADALCKAITTAAARQALSPRFAPMDKSSPAERITSVRPEAMRKMRLAWRNTFSRLPTVRKALLDSVRTTQRSNTPSRRQANELMIFPGANRGAVRQSPAFRCSQSAATMARP